MTRLRARQHPTLGCLASTFKTLGSASSPRRSCNTWLNWQPSETWGDQTMNGQSRTLSPSWPGSDRPCSSTTCPPNCPGCSSRYSLRDSSREGSPLNKYWQTSYGLARMPIWRLEEKSCKSTAFSFPSDSLPLPDDTTSDDPRGLADEPSDCEDSRYDENSVTEREVSASLRSLPDATCCPGVAPPRPIAQDLASDSSWAGK